jgi:hypothetical protein
LYLLTEYDQLLCYKREQLLLKTVHHFLMHESGLYLLSQIR